MSNKISEFFQTLVSQDSIIRGCDIIKNGMMRLWTSFEYPNGDYVDLFFGESGDGFVLTDLGESCCYLEDMGIEIEPNAEIKVFITKDNIVNVENEIIRLAQSCIELVKEHSKRKI